MNSEKQGMRVEGMNRLQLLSALSKLSLTVTLLLNAHSAVALTGGQPPQDPRFSGVIKFYYYGYSSEDQKSSPKYQACSGVFIKRNMILTAGHCLVDAPIPDASKPISLVFWNEATVEVEIKKFRLHPDLEINQNESGEYTDVAVIELSQNLIVTTYPIIKEVVAKQTVVTVTGYGCDKESEVRSERKRSEKLRVGHKMVSAIKPAQLSLTYAPDNRKVSYCSGDSGGAVFTENEVGQLTLVGINSYLRNPFYFTSLYRIDNATRLDPMSPAGDWLLNIQENISE